MNPLILFGVVLVLLVPDSKNDWPEFRGPSSNGHSSAVGLPLKWSETEGVKWKTPIQDSGWSTPAVVNGKVWLTTASSDGRALYAICLDAATGRILLDRKLFSVPNPEPLGNDVNGYASPSPLVMGKRVILHFGSPGTVCLDTTTFKQIWSRTDLKCRHYRGPSSSPVAFEGTVIITHDGADRQYLTALNASTGKTVWTTDRTAEWNDLDDKGLPTMEGDLRKAHSTPIIVSHDGKPVMITAGAKAAYGYDPRTGKELWKLGHKGYSASMRPVSTGRLALLTTGYGGADLMAVPIGSRGAVTQSDLAWKQSKGIPSKPSPIVVDKLVYLITDSGVFSCLDAKTGEQVYSERVGGRFSASPVYAEGRLFLCSEDGKTTVIRPGRKLEVLAENVLQGGFMSSPAISGKALFLRTRTHVYRIEK